MKMYLISDNVDTQIGMRLAGIEGCVVHEMDELKASLDYVLQHDEYAILLITEKLAKQFPELLKTVKLTYYKPLIVEIPDRHGSGRGADSITSYVSDAIGLKLQKG